ncbi:YdeI/OmpD-associated family protein [Algibacter sp.]|uniref:YdeI/OmpD-associated family protein n=1 Tax=Algibacter sp. TaxID=1872428 RepID=UPI003C76F3E7
MKKNNSVEEYIEEHQNFSKALGILRDIINSTEVEETVKWNAPVYSVNGKNVLGLGAFKNHFGIWFFNGVFLKDEQNLLVNAQESKTKALRQMRFESIKDIDKNLVLKYVKEAIENQKLGKEIKPDRSKKEIILPNELKAILDSNKVLQIAFKNLSPSKQREYCEYIDTAKRDATKQTRLEKITPMILQGTGLHDKYKNC